jgi:predicted flap endonuclease-1-like 5' DNA nuclease
MNRKIQDIEGIGQKYAEMLGRAGVAHTDQLLTIGSTAKGRGELAEQSGISEKLILKWVNMCDLFRVKGVAGQYAELLEASGVDTVKELRNRNADNLAEKMREVNKEKELVRTVPGLKSIESWIEQAGKLDPAVYY